MMECELQSNHSHKMLPVRVATICNRFQMQPSGKTDRMIQKEFRLMMESRKELAPSLLLKFSAPPEQFHPEHEAGDETPGASQEKSSGLFRFVPLLIFQEEFVILYHIHNSML
jgi:hypothetical protein